MREAVLGVPREGGERRHLSQRACGWPFQALEKKGISHLEEKELKRREKIPASMAVHWDGRGI